MFRQLKSWIVVFELAREQGNQININLESDQRGLKITTK